MKDLENTKSIFLNLLNIDFKSMTYARKKMLFMNVFFPGMGFFYASSYGLGIIFGIGAMILMVAGMIMAPIRFPSFLYGSMICFGLAIYLHVAAILKSPSVSIKRESNLSAYCFLGFSALILGLSFIFLIVQIWNSIPQY